MLLLYCYTSDWPIFMISCSNEQLQQQLEYTLLKPNCHSWWISQKQSGHEDTLEERYAIQFCFKLGKKWHRNVWKVSDVKSKPFIAIILISSQIQIDSWCSKFHLWWYLCFRLWFFSTLIYGVTLCVAAARAQITFAFHFTQMLLG